MPFYTHACVVQAEEGEASKAKQQQAKRQQVKRGIFSPLYFALFHTLKRPQ
jgi:hypothetical protein